MRSLKLFNASRERARHGLTTVRPNLLMGQRFLVSRKILGNIIAAAGLSKDSNVLEVGAGLGVLTRELAKRTGLVVAVEKDKRLFYILSEELAREGVTNVRLVYGDILNMPLLEVVECFQRSPKIFNGGEILNGDEPCNGGELGMADGKRGAKEAKRKPEGAERKVEYSVVANIPYYLTGRLLRRLLEGDEQPTEIVLMVQKEVAERMVARPPKMNLLALSVQAYGEPEIIAPVPASAFSPKPKVDSAIIKISGISHRFFSRHRIKPEPFFALMRAAFSHKRKTLSNSLADAFGGKEAAAAALKASGLAQRARPEELSLSDWVILFRKWDEKAVMR
ncbi:MAG: hypothetical protein A3B37_01390 [Candidatus Sungbacteria bacterium RIFCSPLOWO2_01_FULL_59_16]|uniref:Ribosomal RNA small subunit methyltransferase A n=1 Tax=Candidatus Sungbacteria bacterium RIFCSPLOWO2_01_FULL_59_16 TaxID=1802280 RepID=A0A1G2LC38_9BACT|nr:MAG: hypothetical protein A3B37_01390 [Candidatus Sungbacteria bacterium RIFCSPLOWO2_01_FULL_59_16]